MHLAKIEDRQNVRMLKFGQTPGFLFEAVYEFAGLAKRRATV
jgi:hypothetical protein